MDDWLEPTNTLLSNLTALAETKEGKLAEQVMEALTELEGLVACGEYDDLILRVGEHGPLFAEAVRKWSTRQSRAPLYELVIAEKPEFFEKKESGHFMVKPALVRSYLEGEGCDLTRVDDDDIRRARRNAAQRYFAYQRALATALRE